MENRQEARPVASPVLTYLLRGALIAMLAVLAHHFTPAGLPSIAGYRWADHANLVVVAYQCDS